jgi:EthD domain
MEKIIYALWRERAVRREDFNRALLEEVAPQLADRALAVRVNVQDDSVKGGSTFRYTSTSPQMEAAVQVWVDSAHPDRRGPIDDLMATVAPRHCAWLVCESTPIRNEKYPPLVGERTEGYSHLAFITRPPRLTWEAWRDRWQGEHTQVAIETQSNFEYVQNLIVRPLTYAAPPYSAIIEECFPMAAFTDVAAFHDAAGDPEKYARNSARLRESTFRFVDEGYFDLIPMSQFDIKPLRVG